ncbi:hypothetical protein ACWGIA_21850 [Streptomyces bobili]
MGKVIGLGGAEGSAAEVAEGLDRLWECVDRHVVPAVPPAQFRVLTLVGAAGVVNSTKIAEAIGSVPLSVSRLIGRLATGAPRAGRPAVSLGVGQRYDAAVSAACTLRA